MKNQRENLIKIWKRRGIGFAPVSIWLCPGQVDEIKKRYGQDVDFRDLFEFPDRDVNNNLTNQEFKDWQSAYYRNEKFSDAVVIDMFGVAYDKSDASIHLTQMYHPCKQFTTLKEFEQYPYPEVDLSQVNELPKVVTAIKERNLLATATMTSTIWEYAWYMRGMEELMMDMMAEDETAIYHLDRITDFQIQRAIAYAKAGVDHIFIGDDIGMQQSIMMSEELYCRHIKWRLAKLIASIKNISQEIIVSYHSCGYIEPFIPHLIEAGIDVLNPIQPECMDFKRIHTEYGDRLSFWGTIGTQSTMPYGTVDEVRRVTFENLDIAGDRGGLLCTPTHVVEPEVPFENILAYVKACNDYKK